MPIPPNEPYDFQDFVKIVSDLLGPDGCPWDKKQTHQSLTKYAIEEAFEFGEAAESGTDQDIQGELGDMLLQVVLNAEIAKKDGRFDLSDIVQGIASKMVRRHPHVFSDQTFASEQELSKSWEQIKAAEKQAEGKPSDPFDFPLALPSLISAHKIGKRTAALKFDWNKAEEVLPKVHEELQELEEAMQLKTKDEVEHEIGDLLFATAQLARHLDLDAETCLRKANHRFVQRFETMHEITRQDGQEFSTLNVQQKEDLWQRAKQRLKAQKNTD